jgi:hypothetical protein
MHQCNREAIRKTEHRRRSGGRVSSDDEAAWRGDLQNRHSASRIRFDKDMDPPPA